jgi:hypothetical protein
MTRVHPAVEERERGLRRIRTVTTVTALVGVGVAGAAAGVAAMTLPGRSTGTASSSTGQGTPDTQGSQGAQLQDGLQVPAQAPQAPSDSGPLVISGSS